jgi:hypothetical protein
MWTQRYVAGDTAVRVAHQRAAAILGAQTNPRLTGRVVGLGGLVDRWLGTGDGSEAALDRAAC